MSLLNQITGQVTIIRSVSGYVFDAVFEEIHTSELEVTDNPVESGVSISDHAYMKPLRVNIKAGVSDVILNPITRFFGSDQFAGGVSRSQTAYKLLTELQASAEPFDVQTGLKLYKNMVCTSIRTSQDARSSSALIFEAELREVIIAYTDTVTYPPRSKAPQAQKPKDGGQKSSEAVANPKKADAILKAADAVGINIDWGKAKTFIGDLATKWKG